ncbi:MAG: cob(I)yrinic acid a,c-diamide adenosyltransferase [Bdellovibrionota bacterium]
MTTGSPKIYTRTGDKGKTSLIGGARVSKAHVRLEAYGSLDELNSVIGLLRHDAEAELDSAAIEGGALSQIESLLAEIQVDLFNVGSRLACEDANIRAKLPSVDVSHIQSLEKAMDEFSRELVPLKNFILPGGSRSASIAHVARTVCRRAERACVALAETDGAEISVESDAIVYVNRLSDFLFVLARHLNHLLGREETLWAPKKT